MRPYLFVIVISLLVVGNLASSACSIATDLRTKMTSGSFNIDYQQNGAKNTSVLDYVHPFKQSFSNVPSTAIGIIGFDFEPSQVMGFQVTVRKQTGNQINFKVGVNQNENWKKLYVNFFSTNRPDFEIGTVNLDTPVTSDNFKLSYNFKNNWNGVNLLKLKVFISSFKFSTNQQTSLRLNLERIDFQQQGLSLAYSTRSQSTVISSFTANLVIFDGLNPALRFSEGVISQDYLSSKITIQVPQKGIKQVRDFIVGITSFDVSTSSPISAYSNLDNKFMIEFGPNSDKCALNLLTVSYLVVSVMNDCGDCLPDVIYMNGKCVPKCPEGYFIKNGQCQAKVCFPGYYVSGNNCLKCPKHSDIKQCNNACPEGTKLRGEQCELICPGNYQIYSYGKCVCVDGWNRIEGVCSKCPKGTRYDYGLNNCVSICPENSALQEASSTCKCNEGYFLLHGYCKKCEPGQVFSSNWGVCYLPCGVNEQFNGSKCVCKFGFNLINNRCSTCEEGSTYDSVYQTCKKNCAENEVWQTVGCVCASNYYRINGKCQSCPGNSIYEPSTQTCRDPCTNGQIWLMNKCQCVPGSYFIDGSCQICPEWARYDASTQKCEPICKLSYSEYYAGICRCVRGFHKQNEQCLPNKCPENSEYNSISDTCVCLAGYYLSKQTGQCEKIKQCPQYSKFVAGQCICQDGYLLSQDKKSCFNCNQLEFEVFTGMECICKQGYARNSAGKCTLIVVPPTCKENQYYNAQSKCCFCQQGFDKIFGKCVKIPECDANSYWNGQSCACKTGFIVGSTGKCEKCPPPTPICDENSSWNGNNCACNTGYVVVAGKCQKYTPPTPLCDQNSVWNGKVCVCIAGYVIGNSGRCEKFQVPIPNCDSFSKWDGQKCVCLAGYFIGLSGKCEKYTPPVPPVPPIPPIPPMPKCPYNSKFNGIKCVCNQKFFEYSPGICATCASNMKWNGRKCAYDKQCWAGFKWNNESQCCVPIDVQCPQYSKWNGQSCQCFAGFNSVGKRCIRCEPGYQFDGSQCARVQQSVLCQNVNTIVAGGVCVCRPGTHEFQGNCIQCLYPTVWNGLFCQGNNDACLTVPYSVVNPTNRKCECINGFRPVQGTCVPYFGFMSGAYLPWGQNYQKGEQFYGDKFTQKWNDRFYNQKPANVVINSQYYGNVFSQYNNNNNYYTAVPNTFGYQYQFAPDFGQSHGNQGWKNDHGGNGWQSNEWNGNNQANNWNSNGWGNKNEGSGWHENQGESNWNGNSWNGNSWNGNSWNGNNGGNWDNNKGGMITIEDRNQH